MKRTVAALVDAVPASMTRWFFRRAAVVPPPLKTLSFERLCRAVSRSHLCQEQLIATNLGISASLRCSVPLYKSNYAFGRLENHVAERATLALVGELSKDCLHFLDIGANEGIFTFSVLVSRQAKIAVHWFEPDDALAGRLLSNLQRNSLLAHANTTAVSDATGRSKFYRNLTDDASGSLTGYFTSKHLTQQEIVETIRLDDYLIAHNISNAIVKIDVEGAGLRVWRGAKKGYKQITYLVMEMIEPEITSRLPSDIINMTGWHAWYIRDLDLVESRDGEFQYFESFWNWLLCGLDAAALAARLAGTGFRVVPAG